MPEAPQRPTVVVADDDAVLRRVMAAALQKAGFEVVEAGTGLEALRAVELQRPRAVVLDLMMPRLGGLDALKQIRASHPAVTVVVTTGFDDAALHRQALALGAVRVLLKPVAPADLVAALQSPRAHSGGGAGILMPAPETSRAPRPRQPAAAGRILVVDDEPEVCKMLEKLLTRKGYHTRSAADGGEAVRAVADEAPDVVLLDIAMPRLGGIEALAAIRAIAPDVKVIMVSGHAALEVAKRALAYGAFDYVTKPIDLGYLSLSVEAALAWKGLDTG
ncbi:MAG: response regulator [Candidatus Rokubacteria bacterium]|nr:response regulator [Candidatus Rokubacteria bacterium]